MPYELHDPEPSTITKFIQNFLKTAGTLLGVLLVSWAAGALTLFLSGNSAAAAIIGGTCIISAILALIHTLIDDGVL